MSLTQWDKMGSVNRDTYPQYMPNAINNRIPFMLNKNTAANAPANPGDWNDSVEDLRVKGIDVLTFLATPLTAAFGKVDEATNGGFSKLMSAGYKNLRSNYAFTRDVADKNAALGLLSSLFTVSGAVMGGAVGFGLGGPVGAAAGASLGAGLYATLQRKTAETEFVERTANQLYRSAKLAESDVGQESYNFGRDVVRFTSKVSGWKTLGDTSKGIGALTSGFLNFGFEVAAAPDINVLKGAGAVTRRALVAPIDEVGTGIVSKRLSPKEAEASAIRFAEDIDLLKRTAAGETTKYTPVFQFYRENSPAVVAQRAEMRGDIPSIASHLVAGADDQTISLILRIGRYDVDAIDELNVKSAAKLAEYTRVSDAIKIADEGGLAYVSYKGQLITANKLAPKGLDYLKQELDSLVKEVQWLQDANLIKGGLTERTASKWSWVERVRNDVAKERAARKLELSKAGVLSSTRIADDLGRETTFGGVIQGVYQRSPYSVLIRWFDRATDDAPRGTINFNDRLLGTDRFRANIRASVRVNALGSDDGLKLFEDFISASDEVTKFNLVQKYTTDLANGLGKKYNLSPMLIEQILTKYDELHRGVLNEARQASLEGRAYMIAKNGDTINDPQLISQLANGSYLPDPRLWDKAFKEYSKKYGAEAGIPIRAGVATQAALDEFQTLWRGFTLLRAGYPTNIIRDSAIRMAGDVALLPALKILATDTLNSIVNASNTGNKVKSALGIPNAEKNLANIRKDIYQRDVMIQTLEKGLADAGVNPLVPLTKIPQEYQIHVKHLTELQRTVAALRGQENAIMAKAKPVKRVSKDSIIVQGYEFPAASAGRFGDISMQQLRMQDDLRRALSSVREIETGSLRRSRTGSRSIAATENEQLHLISWEKILKDQLANDAVARMIMSGASKKEVVSFLRKEMEGQDYLARVGFEPAYAGQIYTRVVEVIKQFAPNAQLQKLILDGKVNVDELRKLYPDVNQRPVVLTDLVEDMLGTSSAYQKLKNGVRDTVSWMATVPTTKLMYAPYFAFKYQHKLQKLIHLANVQGKKLTLKDKQDFERISRSYALGEYRSKLNSFHRDMNYSGAINYIIAFFPAIVEQFRAYGRITLEHPDFLLKAYAIKEIPGRQLEAQVDPISGEEFIEAELPILGLTGRFPASWLNPFNPTGGTLIGAGPLLAASFNEYTMRAGGDSALQKKLENWILPFGVQASSYQALLPNNIRRISQLMYGAILGGGGGPSQWNKDVNMFTRQGIADYLEDNNHRKPSALELKNIVQESENKSFVMAFLRVAGAFTLPAQPRYVTALQPFVDELMRAREADPINGEEDFIYRNPDLFFLADSLSNSLSGIRSDDTALSLVKRNPEALKDLVGLLGEEHISVLGAIFNDDDYAFSSKAQAYLQASKIPFLNKAFKEYGAPLEASRNSVIGRGWEEWTRYVETVKQEIASEPPYYNPNRGSGALLVDFYKDEYLEKQKNTNPLWYEEYMGRGGYGNTRLNKTVDALTYVLNNDKMWKDLSQNPRWYAVLNYLNFRYDVNQQLKMIGTTIDGNNAIHVREDVREFVDTLKNQSPDFVKFYERYFENDKFDYVPGG
jgi:hypothetical protein